MKAQLLLSMLFMLALAIAFTMFIAGLFLGIGRSYTSGANSINSYYTNSSNALAQETQPYSEFHIINTNS